MYTVDPCWSKTKTQISWTPPVACSAIILFQITKTSIATSAAHTHNSNRFHYVQSTAHFLTQNWPESKEGLSVAHANIHTELNASADYRLRDPHRNFSRGETDPVFGPEANSRRPRKTAMSYKLKVFTVDITCDKCGTILIASFDKEVIPFEDGRNAFDLHRCITIP